MTTNYGILVDGLQGLQSVPTPNNSNLLVTRPFNDSEYVINQNESYDKSVVDVNASIADNFDNLVAAINASVDALLLDFDQTKNIEAYTTVSNTGFRVDNLYDQNAVISYNVNFTVYIKVT